ncbi:hypothetical protein M9Y10_044795 [Tritrichomonas musculus]|uniref:sn-1-specific diacylglycerol lipase n=1 Tax=Tritrichomonas musculus TaxID=1915356 RepID=A0ABR2JWC3_9EUKA
MNIYANQTNVTDFSLTFLRLVMQLTMSTFTGSFSSFSGELYYYNPNTDIEQPSFYIYRLNDGNKLFIGTRGTIDINDVAADIAIRQIVTDKGVYLEGYYRAALFVYKYAYAFIKNHDGPIYFIGHSMGGAISTILHCLAKFDFRNSKDINTIALAPVPAISESLNKTYGDKIVTIINSDDVVPTISIANMYAFLVKYEPLIPITMFPWSFIKKTINFVLSIVYHVSSVFSQQVLEYFKLALSSALDELVSYAKKEKQFLIRYPPGAVYQLSIESPLYLNQSLINASDKLNILSLSLHAINAHDPSQYIKLLNVTLGD